MPLLPLSRVAFPSKYASICLSAAVSMGFVGCMIMWFKRSRRKTQPKTDMKQKQQQQVEYCCPMFDHRLMPEFQKILEEAEINKHEHAIIMVQRCAELKAELTGAIERFKTFPKV